MLFASNGRSATQHIPEYLVHVRISKAERCMARSCISAPRRAQTGLPSGRQNTVDGIDMREICAVIRGGCHWLIRRPGCNMTCQDFKKPGDLTKETALLGVNKGKWSWQEPRAEGVCPAWRCSAVQAWSHCADSAPGRQQASRGGSREAQRCTWHLAYICALISMQHFMSLDELVPGDLGPITWVTLHTAGLYMKYNILILFSVIYSGIGSNPHSNTEALCQLNWMFLEFLEIGMSKVSPQKCGESM